MDQIIEKIDVLSSNNLFVCNHDGEYKSFVGNAVDGVMEAPHRIRRIRRLRSNHGCGRDGHVGISEKSRRENRDWASGRDFDHDRGDSRGENSTGNRCRAFGSRATWDFTIGGCISGESVAQGAEACYRTCTVAARNGMRNSGNISNGDCCSPCHGMPRRSPRSTSTSQITMVRKVASTSHVKLSCRCPVSRIWWRRRLILSGLPVLIGGRPGSGKTYGER